MSSTPHTASQQAPAPQRRSGIELSTLLIAGLAAVVAAYAVSRIWAPGTIWATAFTPIVVSLIKEALERPAQKVSAVATRAVTTPRTVDRSAPPPPVVVEQDQGFTERKVYGKPKSALQRRWKLAVVTGLVAFVGVVALFTVPELVAGQSVTSGSHHTTFFGGRRSSSSSSTTKTDTTTTQTTTSRTTTTPTQTTTTPTTTTTTPAQTTPTTTTTTPAPATTTPAPSAAPPVTTPTTP